MQRNECGVLLSASDQTRIAGCAHATTLDLASLMGRGAAPGEDSEEAEAHAVDRPVDEPGRLDAV
jgi:hypothetical protein